jgi:hypothetical protein
MPCGKGGSVVHGEGAFIATTICFAACAATPCLTNYTEDRQHHEGSEISAGGRRIKAKTVLTPFLTDHNLYLKSKKARDDNKSQALWKGGMYEIREPAFYGLLNQYSGTPTLPGDNCLTPEIKNPR